MIENIKRFREPTAWVILLVTVASMVLALVRFGAAVGSGSEGIRAASQDVANSAMNLTLVVLVVAMVGACLFVAPATPRAVGLTRAAALVVTAGTVLTVVATVVGVTASAGTLGVILEALGGLLDIILKLVATVVLWLILRGLSAGRVEVAETVAAVEPAPAPEPPAQAPSWRPSEASGSVWRTASEAAGGAPASGHGQSGGTWHRPDPTRGSGPGGAGELGGETPR